MAQQKQTNQPWGGNLPCCHGPRDGCIAHNSARTPMFWDSSLPSVVKPVTVGFLKTLFGAGNNSSKNKPSQSNKEAAEPEPIILSNLPREPRVLENLPLVHPSVPYTVSFYHVHAVMSAVAAGQDPAVLLDRLTCRGISGSRPTITWSVTPRVADRAFFLEHAYEFPIKLHHDVGDMSYYTKNWFISEGFRAFAPCAHCKRVFRSIREERGSGGNRRLCVEFSLRNVLGQEFRDEWRSEVGRQPENACCGMCYADFCMTFEPQWRAVQVRIWAHRDLGSGMDPLDPKWIAAMGGQSIQRDKKDFGRIRATFRSSQRGGSSQTTSFSLQEPLNEASPPPPPPYSNY